LKLGSGRMLFLSLSFTDTLNISVLMRYFVL